MVELEAKPEKQPALEGAGRDGRVTNGAEQDRVMAADRFKLCVGKDLASGMPAARAEIELGGLEADIVRGCDQSEHLQCLGRDFGSDAVTGHHSKLVGTTHGRHPRTAVS